MGFSSIMHNFKWNLDVQQACSSFEQTFASLPYPLPSCAFVVQTDASDFDLRAIIFQTSEDFEQRLLPCTLYSRQLLKPKRNCDVLNKELLVIRDAFQHWHTSCKKLHTPLKSKQTTRSWSIYSLFTHSGGHNSPNLIFIAQADTFSHTSE